MSPPADRLQRRKVVVVLTETEWRALKIAAATRDTTVQGYMSDAILSRLQRDDHAALDAAASRPQASEPAS